MLSSDPTICLVHPSKRQPVGVCHLCLRDRLARLSLSGDSSSSHNLLPSSSSRSSFDSSCSKTDDSGSNPNNAKSVGKLGTIFSLIESDSEEAVARIEEEECDDQVEAQNLPSCLPRSKSLAQQPPRRSSSTKDAIFSRFPASHHQFDETPADLGFYASKKIGNGVGSCHSPLISASATPVAQHVERDHHHKQQQQQQHNSSSNSKNSLSWISSLFRLRKRKKKSAHNGAVETNFFPPEAWNDEFQQQDQPPHADRDRLWRSRSVSSGRVIKKSFTPLMNSEDRQDRHCSAVSGFEPVPTRSSTTGFESEMSRVASLIALDMSKVINNAAYDVAEVAGPARASVASLMDIDRKYTESPTVLQRSKSTGGWRRKIRSESPSSVLMPPTSNPTAAGSEWSFYLTPLRTFSRNRSSSRHAR